jgi:hypothetical protein
MSGCMKIASAVIAVGVVSALVVACSAGDGSDASYSSGEDELTSSRTDGDWHKFPNGQCLAAIQGFYPAKFGVHVPLAGPGSWGNCAAYGACKIWEDPNNRPDPNVWERIPNDGTHVPQTYDMIVYPPIGGDPWGHIASVDHLEGKNIYVMDSNYVAHELKAPHVHTVSWPALGWYHLRKLGPEPAQVDCVPGGYYCGGDKVIGNKNDLYRCNSGGHGETFVKACANGCRVNAGRDDSCN